jgi:hypothetical protein
MRVPIMASRHDNFILGHQGIKKTTEAIMCDFWWPKITYDVEKYDPKIPKKGLFWKSQSE